MDLYGLQNAHIAADAAIDPAKLNRLRHRENFYYRSTVAAYEWGFNIARGNGTIRSIEAVILTTLPTGDRTVSVDLKRSTSAGALASILSAAISLSSANTLRVPAAGTINTSAVQDNDFWQVVLTLGGTTGNYPVDLLITVEWEEAP